MLARWREHRYRRLYSGLTHEQYLDEPLDTVDWALAFDDLEGRRMKRDAERRVAEAEAKARRAGRR